MSYIGITGFGSREEVKEVLNFRGTDRQIMIGVLMTEKTLNGFRKNNKPNRYPEARIIPGIFPKKSRRTLNLIHYSTKNKDNLIQGLLTISKLVGNNLDGFQLNVPWPKISSISGYKELYPGNKIVLQVGPTALGALRYDTALIAQKLKDYDPFIDYIIFDFSEGNGKVFDVDTATRFLSLAKRIGISSDIVVAGGVNPSNVMALKPILSKFPNVGIDAESGLRNQKDFLDISKVNDYLSNAVKILG
ncbi:MAG: hypothetical protein PHW52_04100 [Candidatus Pacebacteria bacterium]|nr:hypothetical protein [Candidatus Paceibacterota bacterium]